jgi:hypothetical protein
MASHEDRVRYWTELVSEQKQCGLSVQDFCRDRQISIHSYRGWRARLNKDALASAVIYSMVETAKENGLNPMAYLTHVFEQRKRQIVPTFYCNR